MNRKYYVIRHASKGYLLWNKDNPGMFWGGHENTWKQRFHNIDEAEKMAKTLKSLDGMPLKRLEIVEMLEDGSPFGFERAIVHKVIEND